MAYIRSFLKYPGNKYRILDKLLPLFPPGKRFFEPFLGSGVVFANTNYEEYFISDTNEDLIRTFSTLKSIREDLLDIDLIEKLKEYFTEETNNKKYYYKIRKLFNKRGRNIEAVKQFIYLNRYCFNGLCRYNKDGCFNAPFGRHKNVYFPEEELRYFNNKLHSNVNIYCRDFDYLNFAEEGDVVYHDPPYCPLTETGFTNFASNSFGMNDHERLVDSAIRARDNGAVVLISNHDTPLTRELYKDASKIVSFPVRRMIAAKAEARIMVNELVAIY